MSKETTVSLSLDNMPGTIRLTERGPKDERDFWTVIDLVEVDHDEIDFDVRLLPEGIELGLNAHHVENEETGKAFHAELQINLLYSEIEQLRDFLDLILKYKPRRNEGDE
jgi:hypothetical protein